MRTTKKKYIFFLAGIFLFAIVSSLMLLRLGKIIDNQYLSNYPTDIMILMWNVPQKSLDWGSFLVPHHIGPHTASLGHEYDKKCPVICSYTNDRDALDIADAVLFDPSYWDPEEWMREPYYFPYKRLYQSWVSFEHHPPSMTPIVESKPYQNQMDIKMSYIQNSDVPFTYFCNWGGGEINDFLKPAWKGEYEKELAVWVSSNCDHSGAAARTAYVKELIQHMDIDSFGDCLRTEDYPLTYGNADYTEDFGAASRSNVELYKKYKFVLAFENSNSTDFVTETLINAFRAGAVPVYMGAPNIDSFLPGPHSIIKVDDFESPQHLAEYLNSITDEEYNEYFAWKKNGLSTNFKRKFEQCIFYGAECRLCMQVAKQLGAKRVSGFNPRRFDPPEHGTLHRKAYAMEFDGHNSYVVFDDQKMLRLSAKYTIALWIKPHSFGDQRLVDKNHAGRVTGFNFDIQKGIHGKGYLRLCAGDGCVSARKGIYTDKWVHVAVVYNSENPSIHSNYVRFFINGVMDVSHFCFSPTRTNSLPLSFGRPANADKGNNGNTFHGLMDSVYIWNRALADEEIRELMFKVPEEGIEENGLVAYYGFDEDEKTKFVKDGSNNNINGIVVGGVRVPSRDKPLGCNKCT
eukprot:TRINITY_DN73_c0_g4_i1.p1 TRINITY_DN73_c0_g4~~TRINITY_DN73_c0_g4_i1.p1  ORF type:complete len:629 (-),score=106.10 TRINITY_DN73_c0_g4_i1:63-1949(-)